MASADVEPIGIVGFFPEEISNDSKSWAKRAKKTFPVPEINWEEFISSIPLNPAEEEEDEEPEADSEPTKETNTAAIFKADVFADEITPEEQKIIDERIKAQRRKMKERERQQFKEQIKQVKAIHPYVTREEALEALQLSKNDEAEACIFLTDLFNLQTVRKNIALRHSPAVPAPQIEEEKGEESDPEDIVRLYRKRKSKNLIRKSRANATDKTGSEQPKLRLDDALKQRKEGSMEGWSVARIKAYEMRKTNPNAYYYRFNDPGEEQKSGGWTKAEGELFLKRMEEVGVNGQWGVFAMAIPGRVGYQCSNYYRQLVVSGQIKDPNYIVDDKGKAHFLFKGKPRKRRKSNGELEDRDVLAAAAKKAKKTGKKKSKKKSNDDDEDEEMVDSDDDDYRPARSSREEEVHDPSKHNPLPGFVDHITLEEVIKPAISPYGHVLSYSTWIDCLKNSGGKCPITKNPLKPRELTVLTWENIEEHRSKIRE
ncbi:hypothetical protein PROFUN_07196 [Planoprotostelium fungivorum]|uniref:Myb-like domain-containing protein n=1 Tax=Planoprotostelium fungivorum TaxID=1890364 RepID=A0A2P6NMC7_9EUKA|nr:hypothetical protein PROFUN_07196 [Planoprotostelium fungivorum]